MLRSSIRTITTSARQSQQAASGSSRWFLGAAALGLAGGAAYTLRTPVRAESRPSFSERVKAAKPVEIRRAAKVQEEEVAEETPEPIEVAAEGSSQQSAYNEETGEINWDCPCLGGMAHGPCGEDFKAAFSCFVYSEEEPKGIECVDKFKAMQDCFRKYPEIYAEEIEDDQPQEALEQAQDAEPPK